MDPGALCSTVCVVMLCLLGGARFSSANNCSCPQIPPRRLTEPPPQACYQLNSSFRYTCVDGYVRKVGTSNLSRCKETDGVPQWSTPSLECIPDPKRTTTQPPTTTENESHSDNPHDSIITTTVKTSTSPNMTWNVSTIPSVAVETDSVAPTQNGKVNSGLQTTAKTQTTQNTTSSPSIANNYTIAPPEAQQQGIAEAAGITSVLVIICAVIGISFFLYRRKSQTRFPQGTTEEMMAMNHSPAGVA